MSQKTFFALLPLLSVVVFVVSRQNREGPDCAGVKAVSQVSVHMHINVLKILLHCSSIRSRLVRITKGLFVMYDFSELTIMRKTSIPAPSCGQMLINFTFCRLKNLNVRDTSRKPNKTGPVKVRACPCTELLNF